MQMAAATAAIANGGTLFEPHLVRAIIRDGVREEIAPKALRRAIATATAATLTTMMEDVVVRGTAKAAAIPGYQVAGKTGTAQKIVNKAYSSSNHYGSFTGFVPSRRPALAVLVVIDDPKTGGFFGGTVAAPVFQKFAEAALRHLGIAPTLNPTTPLVVQSDAVLPARYSGRVPDSQRGVMQANGAVLMPDVTGMGARDATRVLMQLGLAVRMSGNGVVITQSPAVGETITSGAVSRLELGRQRPTPPAGGRQ